MDVLRGDVLAHVLSVDGCIMDGAWTPLPALLEPKDPTDFAVAVLTMPPQASHLPKAFRTTGNDATVLVLNHLSPIGFQLVE